MTGIQLGVGTHPIRMNLLIRAGEPFEHLIPVEDSAGAELDQTAWDVTCAVLTVDKSQTLAVLTVDQDADGLTLSATAEQTALWATTWPLFSPWRLKSVHPSGEPIFSVAGWVSLYR
jgi:hypothetical protein